MIELVALTLEFIIFEHHRVFVRSIEGLFRLVFGLGVLLDWSVVNVFFVGSGVASVLLGTVGF
jgi:hypothetical protein